MKSICINPKTINRLTKVSNSIYNRYLLLSRLEARGQINTDKYNSVKEEISLTKDVEKAIFCQLDMYNANSIIRYLGHGLENINFGDDFNAIISDEDIVSVIRRLINKLSFYFLVKQSIYDIDETIPYFNYLESYPTKYSKVRLGKALEADTINRFIYYIEEECKKEENQKYKKRLLEAKYNMLYLNDSILNNKEDIFDDEERLIITSYDVGKKFDIAKEVIDLEVNRYNKDRYNIQKQNLEVISDKKYEDDDYKIKAILVSCLLKAILVGYSDKEIDNLLAKQDEIKNSKFYRNFYSDSNISSEILQECFRKAKIDKQKLIIK